MRRLFLLSLLVACDQAPELAPDAAVADAAPVDLTTVEAPPLARDPETGQTHAVHRQTSGGLVHHQRDNTANWQHDPVGMDGQFPVMDVDDMSRVHVAAIAAGRLLVARRVDGVWSVEDVAAASAEPPKLAPTDAGKVLVGFRTGEGRVSVGVRELDGRWRVIDQGESPAFALTPSGRSAVLCLQRDGGFWCGSGQAGDFVGTQVKNWPGEVAGLSLARTPEGRLELLFHSGADLVLAGGHIGHKAWGHQVIASGDDAVAAAMTATSDGRLFIARLRADGSIVVDSRSEPDGPWSSRVVVNGGAVTAGGVSLVESFGGTEHFGVIVGFVGAGGLLEVTDD